jgi:hypothetical protein
MNRFLRFYEAWKFARQLDRNLAARKHARQAGQIYVSGHVRRRRLT